MKIFIENREDAQLRAEHDPDLIILVTRDWANWVTKGMVGVHTADGR